MVREFKPLQFGVNIHTRIQPGVNPVAEAQHAEQLGFDVVTLHGDAQHGSDPSYELWTLLSWVAAHTTSIRVAPVVLALPHRHPAVLAKMAETLDRLSQGRLLLVLGGGGPMNEAAYRALGLAQRSPREKVEALEEAMDLLRGLWSASGFSYPGQHFRTEGATIEPKPSHPIPTWLGVFGDRMLDLAGRKADGWLPTYQFLEPEQAFQKVERIRSPNTPGATRTRSRTGTISRSSSRRGLSRTDGALPGAPGRWPGNWRLLPGMASLFSICGRPVRHLCNASD